MLVSKNCQDKQNICEVQHTVPEGLQIFDRIKQNVFLWPITAELKVELYAKAETGPPYPTYLRHRKCDFLYYLKLLWRVNSVKPSRASSQVRWLRCKYMKF
jgi:hypothetical protein